MYVWQNTAMCKSLMHRRTWCTCTYSILCGVHVCSNQTVGRSAKTARMALETHQNTPEVHVPTHRPKGPLRTLGASCETSHKREFCNPGVIIFIIIFIFFRPAISLLGPDKTLFFHHAPPWALEVCRDIERSPFSSRASQGQIVALRMGRLEGRHCCSGACV